MINRDQAAAINPIQLCHPKVVDLLKEYAASSHFLFGITGDIDDLGEYVARNGRARGENLVDHYTRLIELYLDGWKQIPGNDVRRLCFIPAGEEVSIFGIVNNTGVAERLFGTLKSDFRALLHSFDHYLGSEKTSITFGCKLFVEGRIRGAIREFVLSSDVRPVGDIYPNYLAVLELLRAELALEVDREKFRSIDQEGGRAVVALRNFVYFKLLEYKSSTFRLLPLFHRVIKTVEGFEEELGGLEGLDDDKEETLKKIQQQHLAGESSHV
jgi:hypothetical protein